jgi:hypothetical protein
MSFLPLDKEVDSNKSFIRSISCLPCTTFIVEALSPALGDALATGANIPNR